MEFLFFINDNKSGYKTREKWFSNQYPNEYQKIIDYSIKTNLIGSFKEKIWFYFNQLTERPKCVTCGSEIKFRERFDKPYGDFCSIECINNNKIEMISRQKKTFNEKYGVNFYPEHSDFIKKQRKTKFEKYGDENFNNVSKSKKTKLIKYGNENFNNFDQYKKTCNIKYGVDNYSISKEYKEYSIKRFQIIYPDILFSKITKSFIEAKCNKCGGLYNINKQMMYERSKRHQEVCTICNPFGQQNVSSHEIEVSKFLSDLDISHKRTFRGLPNGKEIDIFIPTSNIGIEINGLYWHNENFLPQNYHLDKTNECEKEGIKLMHIFEDEWIYKKDIVKSIIKNKLKLTNNSIFARKCIIKEVDSKTSTQFLEENHIQGGVNSKIRIGLFYNDKLVSIMTFSKGRVLMGGKSNEWELNRFANIINTNVIGSAGKIFSYFLKKYKPNKVISYSDVRLFQGNLYNTLGFTQKQQSPPNYWYIIGSKRFHRFNFRKDILVKEGYDNKKTEKEIMYERKIFRIYDCGNIRWEFFYS